MLDSKVGIGESLRLDSLRSVNDKNCSFAGRERTRDFVVEVNVTGGVDEVENVCFAVLSLVFQADCTSLYRDASFTLDIHVVEELIFHVTDSNGLGFFENSVGKGRFAVVYVSDYAEISDFIVSQVNTSFNNIP